LVEIGILLNRDGHLVFIDGESEVPKATRFAVPEPGNKVRIVTMTHASLSLYLQPFSH